MEREHLGRLDSGSRLSLMPSEEKTSVPCDYAKCKNRAGDFTMALSSVGRSLEFAPPIFRGWKFAMTDNPSRSATTASAPEQRQLTPAAKRALAEAEERRKAAEANATPMAKEFQGPKGPEPTRYGDWENKGIASDF
jgi:hypothetical protein